MHGSLPISEDLKEFLGLLKSHELEFIVLGSHALAYWGVPRFTEDINLFIRKARENISKLKTAVEAFGMELDSNACQQLYESPHGLLFIGRKPNRIDILNFLDGVQFEDAWLHKVTTNVAGVEVAILSKADYLATKRASARPKTLADVALLENMYDIDLFPVD